VTGLRFYGHQPASVESGDMPGRLIVLEGTDGVGRSTQIALITEWLEARGYAVVSTGLRRSDLAGRGIARAKRGNTLDPLTLSLFYAADFWDRLERRILPALRAGMVALVDRYVFSLIARAIVRGVAAEWMEGLYGFALVPDLVVYLDIDVEHLLPRVLGSTGLDYWESGDDFLAGPDLYHNFVEYQTQLLDEFRRLAKVHHFRTVDARGTVSDVFQSMVAHVSDVVQELSPDGFALATRDEGAELDIERTQDARLEHPFEAR
jgi:dTMP kinase